jgi:hypothetical protein
MWLQAKRVGQAASEGSRKREEPGRDERMESGSKQASKEWSRRGKYDTQEGMGAPL